MSERCCPPPLACSKRIGVAHKATRRREAPVDSPIYSTKMVEVHYYYYFG